MLLQIAQKRRFIPQEVFIDKESRDSTEVIASIMLKNCDMIRSDPHKSSECVDSALFLVNRTCLNNHMREQL